MSSLQVPDEGTPDWEAMVKAAELRQQWNNEGSHAKNGTASVRAGLSPPVASIFPPDTDLTIQLYVIVDYYLYTA